MLNEAIIRILDVRDWENAHANSSGYIHDIKDWSGYLHICTISDMSWENAHANSSGYIHDIKDRSGYLHICTISDMSCSGTVCCKK